MRDNHDGMPEILDAYERDGHFHVVVQVVLGGRAHAFEIGVEEPGYRTMRQVLQKRPFAVTTAGRYRYFFVPSVGRVRESSDEAEFSVRIEQGEEGRQFPVVGPMALAASLLWFFELRDPARAQHLRAVDSRPEV